MPSASGRSHAPRRAQRPRRGAWLGPTTLLAPHAAAAPRVPLPPPSSPPAPVARERTESGPMRRPGRARATPCPSPGASPLRPRLYGALPAAPHPVTTHRVLRRAHEAIRPAADELELRVPHVDLHHLSVHRQPVELALRLHNIRPHRRSCRSRCSASRCHSFRLCVQRIPADAHSHTHTHTPWRSRRISRRSLAATRTTRTRLAAAAAARLDRSRAEVLLATQWCGQRPRRRPKARKRTHDSSKR
jgi:hypothetical protein